MKIATIAILAASTALAGAALSACAEETTEAGEDLSGKSSATDESTDPVKAAAGRMIDEGRTTFRFDTFGDQAFWGGALKLHQGIAGVANGGVGPGMSPMSALTLGLKIDVEALPGRLADALEVGDVDFTNPVTTLTLLQHDAVVGLKGFFDSDGKIESIGIQCALCHSVVDDSFAAGIGKRLDGWPNRDLDVGTLIAVAPDLSVVTNLLGVDEKTLKTVLLSWGPGKFDAAVFLDGKALGPGGKSAATLIPAAFGMSGVNMHTYTGWGSVTYWNAFVANLEMHGQGTFYDPRLADAERFPIAAANGFDDVRSELDLITPKLAALHFYQLALEAPPAPADRFDAAAAERGREIFRGDARCATCHVPPLFTEPGWNMHTAEEIGIDDFQAKRSPDQHYRTTPLKGLWTRQKGGFYHDGRFADLMAVVEHYNAHFALGLNPKAKTDLVEYLKSL